MSSSIRAGFAAGWRMHPAPRRLGGSMRASLAALLLCAIVGNAWAANPDDWWVHITNDRAQQVSVLLKQGADPNEIGPDGQPAIMQAIRDKAWDVYDVIVAHPDTVYNAINIYRETPLMYLAVIGETDRARDLIRRGALVNRLGWTPLQYAASTAQLETMAMLLQEGAIVNAPGPGGLSALMMAAYSGSQDAVQLLLNAGADVAMKDELNRDAAAWARLKGHDKLADKLDDLSRRVVAERQGKPRPEGGSKPSASQPSESPKAEGPAKQNDESTGSNSQYFDLKRFE